jgi:hypothetical protein
MEPLSNRDRSHVETTMRLLHRRANECELLARSPAERAGALALRLAAQACEWLTKDPPDPGGSTPGTSP